MNPRDALGDKQRSGLPGRPSIRFEPQKQSASWLIFDGNVEFGGHQKMMVSILAGMGSLPDREVMLLAHRSSSRFKEELRARCPWVNLLEHDLDPSRGSWLRPRQWKEWLRIVTWIRSRRPDRLLVLSGGCEGAWRGSVLGALSRVPVTQYLPNTRTMSSLGAKFGALRDSLALAGLALADRVVVIAEHQRVFLVARGFREASLRTFRNFIPEPEEAPPSRNHSGRLRVGIVGRIDYFGKGFDLLTALAGERSPRHQYHVIGDGPDRVRVERELASSIQEGSVVMHGWCDPWQSELDLLFMPTRMEGVPLVVIEAILRSIPVVGSDLPELREMLPPQWLFDRDAPDGLEEIMSRVHADRDSERMRVLRDRYRAEYVRRPTVEDVLDVFALSGRTP